MLVSAHQNRFFIFLFANFKEEGNPTNFSALLQKFLSLGGPGNSIFNTCCMEKDNFVSFS
jgi:hypothetical protein